MREGCKKLSLAFCVLPLAILPTKMKSSSLGCEPNLVQRFLQIDNDLTAIWKSQCHHATHPLVVHIRIGFVIDTVAASLYRLQQRFRLIEKFGIGHYNFTMLRTKQILVRTLVLGVGVFNLVACGQTGSLYLPTRSTPVKQPVSADSTKSVSQAIPAPAVSTGAH